MHADTIAISSLIPSFKYNNIYLYFITYFILIKNRFNSKLLMHKKKGFLDSLAIVSKYINPYLVSSRICSSADMIDNTL